LKTPFRPDDGGYDWCVTGWEWFDMVLAQGDNTPVVSERRFATSVISCTCYPAQCSLPGQPLEMRLRHIDHRRRCNR